MNSPPPPDKALEASFIPDILASRYASPAMLEIWHPHSRILLERELWIVILKAQKCLGVAISQADIDACQQVKTQISLTSLARRERALRHDVKAHLEEFCALAGHQRLHLGLTSRDITDNVEQVQLKRSLTLLLHKSVAVLLGLATWSERYAHTLMVARTHNVPAQPTSLGKRLASFGESLLQACRQLQTWLAQYPLRGIKGATGTQLDLISLLPGGKEDVVKLEKTVAKELGFSSTINALGQIYPRELDLEASSLVYRLTAPLASLATTLRLMAGQALWTEGFKEGQVGSSAMPHKMNSRNCERISGLHTVLGGYQNMCAGIAGNQWNEGDVSCSVVRRVALPGLSFAADGLLETTLTVLNEMSFAETALAQEFQNELPLIASSTLLIEALKQGGGREDLHKVIKECATTSITTSATTATAETKSFAQRLGKDTRFPLNQKEIEATMSQTERWLASAPQQTSQFAEQARQFAKPYPAVAKPAPLL